MKKIFLTAIGFVAGATLVHAQGYVELIGNAAAITTNTTGYLAQGAGTTGKTFGSVADPGYFDYAILWASSTTAGDSSPLGSDWQVLTANGGGALAMNNGTGPGLLTGTGGASGTAVDVASGTTVDVMLVGWSSNLGTSWSTVENLLYGGFASGVIGDFFGNTGISTMTPFSAAGGGDPTVFPSIFANGSLVLYEATEEIPIPEPTTLALASLGGLSILLLRRRKA